MSTSTTISDLMAESGVGFGTSGARGRVADMTPSVCYAYTLGFLQYLGETDGLPAGSRVAIAGDLRPSTPGIMAAVARAARDAGYQPVNCGFIPSPAVALFGLEEGIPAIMVTGSHIPDDRNGIKFNKLSGEILKEDEAGIRAQTVSIPDLDPGELSAALPAVDAEAAERYRDRYLNFFGPGALGGMRVGLYEHSGVGRDLLAEILAGLGADLVPLGRSDVFVPVDTEAIRPEDVVLGRDWAAEHGLDAIVSTDGDADRPLVGTESGEWLRGDVAGILCARFLGVRRVVTPVSSNTAVDLSGWFDEVVRTRIGSPYVVAAMTEAARSGDPVGGYEANGGFLLETDVRRDDRGLSRLPTRDATIVILAVLLASREAGVPVSGLLDTLPARYTASDRIKAFPTELSRQRISGLAPDGDDCGRINQAFGDLCGTAARVDQTDGLRITFDSGEIVHLRPSGNAPELRCYNEADSAARAAELNAACMARLAEWRA